ncbi:5-methylcytosine-specific restriction endonuclease McrA [Actinoplanes lutulentus]|uniref:5-methylcytosine-specific restriction endonuclease McrA n=1 Tax=Actinoplanes lutulentus TaxID=1287878 RepID=A0A327YXC1_9ACTN|nr:HNH endonuclease [Actinoplanes lutulentus]MBB2948995.1 5-methylcytosine-specific restriction endonuclease McrA [Actinoplanes lutulentus]RAK26226.1 5-methylcytosine-specific restriction endonuclease McrA [Actinoplanes lutulentus]
MTDVLVLNADEMPLQRVSLRHAIRMLVRQVAEVAEAQPDKLIGVYPMPTAVRLVRYVVTRWRHARTGPAWSKQGVLKRDNRRCAYCAGRADTVDHILPVSRAGRNTWANTVAACSPCNQRKADRTPDEARMRLLVQPATPAWATLAHR